MAGDVLGAMDYDAVTEQIYVSETTAKVVGILAPVVYASGAAGSEDTNGSNDSMITTFAIPHEPAQALPRFAGSAAVASGAGGADDVVLGEGATRGRNDPEGGGAILYAGTSPQTSP
jgi:hypothetical protein